MDKTLPAEVSLPELARKLAEGLETPGQLNIGEFAQILERLHSELMLMKEHQSAPAAQEIVSDAEWVDLIGAAVLSDVEAHQDDVVALADILAAR